jgi:hypothetical protein
MGDLHSWLKRRLLFKLGPPVPVPQQWLAPYPPGMAAVTTFRCAASKNKINVSETKVSSQTALAIFWQKF